MKKILMFVNPRSRQGSKSSEALTKWLSDRQFHILNPDYDPERDDCVDLIRKHSKEAAVVIVGGGDGSVNHALQGLIDFELPLLVLPMGTANNLARTLNIPTDPLLAIELLEKGRVKKVDVGLINDIPFMNVIGLGLSTQVNRLTQGENKKFWGVFAFIWMAFKVGLRMRPFRAHITCDGQTQTVRTLQISICNGRNYGSGLVIHEDAGLTDQILHGLSTEIKKVWHLFGLIPSLLMGRYSPAQDVTPFQGKSIEIATKRPMHVDVDGDLKTKTPVKISVLSKALSIYVPEPVPD